MKNYDLSILIPARNEEFISNTVRDILNHKRGNTEVIVGLDGEWANPGIEDHPDVRIVYVSESRGQRGMTNTLCRLSNAKYVAKADAHTAYDEGFDVKLMDAMKGHDDWTIVPIMRNLHVFDWVCTNGHRRYQSPSGPCDECGEPTEKDIVWNPKPSPQSRAYSFDPEPHFQYFGEWAKRPGGQGELTPTMSLQGSFFMLTRDKYWELNICDEEFGSWGSQGIEVAVKTWLSGGSVMVNHNTWYGHMFRTQGGDFGFPYPLSGNQIAKAKHLSRELFFENQWPLQKRPISWLLEKFWPVPHWSDQQLKELHKYDQILADKPSKGIIYYTDNRMNTKIARRVQGQLRKVSDERNIPIVSASLKPMDKMGKNIHVKAKRGYLTMFKQILTALEASTADIIFMCEHDVLYPPEHFDFTPPDKDTFYYDHNWWRIHSDGLTVRWEADQVSGLCAYRELLVNYYNKLIYEFDEKTFKRRFEPMSGTKSQSWMANVPYVDIRGDWNVTGHKRSLADFRRKDTAKGFEVGDINKIPGWNREDLPY